MSSLWPLREIYICFFYYLSLSEPNGIFGSWRPPFFQLLYTGGECRPCDMTQDELRGLVGVSRPITGPVRWTAGNTCVPVSGLRDEGRPLTVRCCLQSCHVNIVPLLYLAHARTTQVSEGLDGWSGTASCRRWQLHSSRLDLGLLATRPVISHQT